MKHLIKFNLVFTLGIVSLFIQLPAIAWIRFYGGADTDGGYSVQQTTDGGYIVAGRTYSYGTGAYYNVYLIKTDSLGDTLWTRTYDRDSTIDIGHSVQQTTDGGYIVAGYTHISEYNRDVYLIKTNNLGDTLWTRTYNRDSIDYSTDDCGYSVQQTTDGGYIVAGSTDEYTDTIGWSCDAYLIKTNNLGDTLWTRTYGDDSTNEEGYSVQQTTDGGYIVAGWNGDAYLIKTDSLGDTLWTRTYGGTEDDWGESVQQTTDGGYIVAGYTKIFVWNYDIYLIKTDSLGDTLWTRTYGGTDRDMGYSVQQTTDGGYIIAGYIDYASSSDDIYLIKTDSLGDTLWTRIYGGAYSDLAYSVQQTTDGGYIIAGSTRSYGAVGIDVCLIKVNAEGSGIEEKIITGLLSFSPADPNPFVTKTTVKYELTNATDVNISIYNLLGQEVKKLYSGKQSSGVHSISWDGSGNSEKLSAGIYFLRIEAGNQEASAKLTFIR